MLLKLAILIYGISAPFFQTKIPFPLLSSKCATRGDYTYIPKLIYYVKFTNLYLRECGGRVVRQPADPVPGVSVVERVAAVRGGQAQVSASLHGGNILNAESISINTNTAIIQI